MSEAPSSQKKPGGVIIYDAYRVGMIGFYTGFVALGTWAYASDLNVKEGGPIMGLSIAVIGLLCIVLFAGSFWVPRKPWAWNVHLVLVVLGVVALISAPCALLVGVLWFRQDTMAWFGQELASQGTPSRPQAKDD